MLDGEQVELTDFRRPGQGLGNRVGVTPLLGIAVVSTLNAQCLT